jgi:ATP adenylyltransferase
VLKQAGGRCELCGVSSKEIQIDVDHIVPRARGGGNESSNLQALCRRCNAEKRDKDDTDFRDLHEQYETRAPDCWCCEIKPDSKRLVAENRLAVAVRDKYPVTKHHTLFIPRRHATDFFDLHASERRAIEQLLDECREELTARDKSINGWNLGVNVGGSAGQTVEHAHMHLIPRRAGDNDTPEGGVRGVIPEKQSYR